MSEQTNNGQPKKSSKKTMLFVAVALILSFLGMDYYKFHFILGTDVVVTDSTSTVVPAVDTVKPDTAAKPVSVVDTSKKDTTKN